jgi:hypothetical protein
MNEEQLQALMAWVEAVIAEKLEDAFGRDSLRESINERECRDDLYVALGLREKKQ